MERGRTELLAEKGIDIAEYHAKGYFFPVVHVDISYRRPAKLGNILDIRTEVIEINNASLLVKHEVYKDAMLLVEATVKLACITAEGKPRRLPEEFQRLSPAGN